MKFTTTADINMTCLQGYVESTYAELVACFGPSNGGGDKTTQEWTLAFTDSSTVASIYDWKTGVTPLGKHHWHVGGHSNLAVGLVQQALSDFRSGYDIVDVEVNR